MSEFEAETVPEPDWRDDPGWKLVSYDRSRYKSGVLQDRPPVEAELASPPIWATLYDGRIPVANWWRPRA